MLKTKLKKAGIFVLYNIAVFVTVFLIAEIVARLKFGETIQYETDNRLIFVLKADQQEAFVFPGHRSKVSIDKQRYRETNPKLESPDFNILTVGDSYTFGWGVNDDETWTAVMEQELRSNGIAINLYNAGVPAYSTEQILDNWRLEIGKRPYDMVIFGLWPSDELRYQPKGEAKKKLIRRASFRFKLRHSTLITAIYHWLTFKLRNYKDGSKVADRFHMAYNNFSNRDSVIAKGDFNSTWAPHLKNWVELAENPNSGEVVVLQFAHDDFGSTSIFTDFIRERNEILIDAWPKVDSLDQAGIDISAGPHAGHFGVETNKVIGDLAADRLEPVFLKMQQPLNNE